MAYAEQVNWALILQQINSKSGNLFDPNAHNLNILEANQHYDNLMDLKQ